MHSSLCPLLHGHILDLKDWGDMIKNVLLYRMLYKKDACGPDGSGLMHRKPI